jgi:hypothetical protein
MSNTSNRVRSSRGEKVKRKLHRHMELFLVEGGSCSYDDESIGDVEVPLRCKHIVRRWVPNQIPRIVLRTKYQCSIEKPQNKYSTP